MKLDIVFKTIDFWGRAIFYIPSYDFYLSSLNTLFPDSNIAPSNTVEEIIKYFKDNPDQLTLHGRNYDDDPLGTSLKSSITLNFIYDVCEI